MRSLFRRLRRRTHQEGKKVAKECRELTIPSINLTEDPYQAIRSLYDLERRFGSTDKFYEQITKCVNELRDGPAKIENDLNRALSTWRRSVGKDLFVYSAISVGTSTAALIASAIGFIPVYGQLALGNQLIVQVTCIPLAEWRHRLVRQSLGTADKALEDPECIRGVKFLLRTIHGRDAVVDAVLRVVLKLVQQNECVDAKHVKPEIGILPEVSSTQWGSSRAGSRTDVVNKTSVDALYESLRALKAPMLINVTDNHPKNLLPLLKELAGAVAWVKGAIPGFLLECFAGTARAAEFAISLLCMSRHLFHSILSSMFDRYEVVGTVRDFSFAVGKWIGYGLFALNLAAAVAAFYLSWLALCITVENCKTLHRSAERERQTLQSDADEIVNAIKQIWSQVRARRRDSIVDSATSSLSMHLAQVFLLSSKAVHALL
ncbi:unnamed protein product [Phytophthora fragariaefolia]|uniref:Unnamed protein product n=1 Tax=Phytophthora fragariaefolia TaxID=1490495 RepID=A0A9W7CWD3_9STRA|nr:unnamed protein product [Phytophthora fragariaefolia]